MIQRPIISHSDMVVSEVHMAITTGGFSLSRSFRQLDNPGEFLFEKKTGKLYLSHNGTGAPSASSSVVVPQKQALVRRTGTQWDPVRNINLSGTRYTATVDTHMEPLGVASAGD